MTPALRKLVRERAAFRCEYCHLPEAAMGHLRFQIEHLRARQHGGSDDESNLGLACPDCNQFKGPNQTAYDPETDVLVRLFHPRTDIWAEHFSFQGAEIFGLTSTGRATVALLQMNKSDRAELRSLIMAAGEW
jgi:hypothetical protein